MGFPHGAVVKNLPADARDAGSILGSERIPGVRHHNPLQYCLKNSMDRGACMGSQRVRHDWATEHAQAGVIVNTRHGHFPLEWMLSQSEWLSAINDSASPQCVPAQCSLWSSVLLAWKWFVVIYRHAGAIWAQMSFSVSSVWASWETGPGQWGGADRN